MTLTPNTQQIPVKLVGGSSFGRYETISSQRTYNMFLSTADDNEKAWLVNYAGYKAVIEMVPGVAEGRGIFHSVRGGFMLVVVGADVYRVDSVSLLPTLVNSLVPLNNSTGEVFMDENLNSQILIVNGTDTAYIYNYGGLGSFGPAVLKDTGGGPLSTMDLHPNYVTYQNTYFIVGNALSTPEGSQWFVFMQDTAGGTQPQQLKEVTRLAIQSKPDYARAALRIPGQGNNLILFGESVSEIWTNVAGLQIYQRQSSFNIDFGVASVSTIAANDEYVAWLGINEKSTPSIMAMKGGTPQRISTDGIDYKLSIVQFPRDSTAFFYRQDGHLFYQLTFFNAADNFTLVYDFTTNIFIDLVDWDYTAHPARQVAYFNNETYFIGYKNGNLYQFDTDLTQYQVETANINLYDIPRIRITDTYRMPTPEKFLIDVFTFVIESGTTPEIYASSIKPRVDVAMSKDGGITWSNNVSFDLKRTGDFKNQIRFNRLGAAQQITFRLSFWGSGRMVVNNGAIEVRQ